MNAMPEEEKSVEELMNDLDELIETDLEAGPNGARASSEADREIEELLDGVSKSVDRMRSLKR